VFMQRWCVLASVCLGSLSLQVTAQNKGDAPKQPAAKSTPDKKKILASAVPGYTHRFIEGFDVLIHHEVLEHDKDPKYKRSPSDVLKLELGTLTRVMPPKCVQVLRSIIIWADWDDQDDPDYGKAVAKYYGVWGNRTMWSLGANKNRLKAN